MRSERPIIFVDTTTTFVDVMMTKTRWMQILSLCAKDRIRVVISTVVLRETGRHWEEQAKTALTRVLHGQKSLAELGLGESDVAAGVREVTVDPDAFCERQINRLTSLGVEILPSPNVGVAEILDRDLARRKPFAKSGKGFRDVLIWHSVKERSASLPKGSLVYFVSNNTNDYWFHGKYTRTCWPRSSQWAWISDTPPPSMIL